ncbi:MAG: ATP-binding cassette domain-containing protein [Gammaproteobacteria bacterium]|nr:MAG: ATP-binding cassette domain-containing protein [Gammaproteobacteria bacterium]
MNTQTNTPAGESLLSVNHARKKHGRLEVLKGLDLALVKGELFALTGANGSGKTTLFKAILDLNRLDKGSIRFGALSSELPHARSDVAYLPENFCAPPYLTGREFLHTIVALAGTDELDETTVQSVCTSLDFDMVILNRSVKYYSQGMTQKLGIAACLLSNKSFLIMDEPMNGLDPVARALLKREFSRQRALGTTILFSTHLLSDVTGLADRMAILHNGHLHFIGNPAELVKQYQTTDLESAYLSCLSAE